MVHRPQITLVQLTYFVEAARCRSMSTAATELHVAQSAISAAIAQLELQLGAQLFIRQRSKGLALTAAGEQFLRDARSLLTQLDEAMDVARGIEHEVRGTVRIACFVTLAPFVLSRVLSQLEAAHPQMAVHVVEVHADEAERELRSGEVELALTYDFGYGSDIRTEAVAHTRPHLVLPPDHALAGAGRASLRQLAGEPLILLDLPRSREYFLGMFSALRLEARIRHRTTSYETVRALVARGHGYSILNQRPVSTQTYEGGRVSTLELTDDLPSLPVVIATLASSRVSARGQAVALAIREALEQRVTADGGGGHDGG